MKLWFTTANGSQQSRCSEIGSPEGEKMPTLDYLSCFKGVLKKVAAYFMNNSGKFGLTLIYLSLIIFQK